MKCYKNIFSIDGLKKNIGSYIILFIILLLIISCIYFYCKGYKYIFNIINIIMTKKKYNNKSTNKSPINNNNMLVINNNNRIIKKKKIIKKDKFKKKKKKNQRNKLYFSNLITSNKSSSKIQLRNSKKIININENNKKATKNKKLNNIIYSDSEINTLSYEEAIIKDKRTFFQYYFSLIKTKHIIFFAFYPTKDYNSRTLKICLFFYSFAVFYFVNTLFFNDEAMHKIYEDEGIFNFIYFIPQMIYSSLISSIINTIIRTLSLSEGEIIKIKKEVNFKKAEKELPKIKKQLLTKFILFFLISFLFLNLFWYYISCFGAIYKNTQLYVLKDTLISFSISMIYPFIIYLFAGCIRIPLLKKPSIIYKLANLIQSC